MKTISVSKLDESRGFTATVKGKDLRGDSDRIIVCNSFERLVEALGQEFDCPDQDALDKGSNLN